MTVNFRDGMLQARYDYGVPERTAAYIEAQGEDLEDVLLRELGATEGQLFLRIKRFGTTNFFLARDINFYLILAGLFGAGIGLGYFFSKRRKK